MPLVPFVDNELIEEMSKIPNNTNNENEVLEEYNFIANCLKIGLRIDDLKQLTYKDVAKIMLCFSDNRYKKSRKASQSDWDKLARKG